MQNILQELKNDFLRLVKSPATLIVVVALVILPCLYTWVNVYAFWNPYNNTDKMQVCFVNEDKGASTEIAGDINVGDMINEALKINHQLKWDITDREDAIKKVKSGEAYAAFIVGEEFSSQLASLDSANFTRPKIEYYVNEKVNAVSPKITDTGSTTLDETINSTFVTVITENVINKLDDTLLNSDSTLAGAEKSIDSKLTEARKSIENTKEAARELESAVDSGNEKIASAKNSVAGLHSDVDAVEQALGKVKTNSVEASQALMEYSNKIIPALNSGWTDISKTSLTATTLISNLSSDIISSQSSISVSLEQQKALLSELNQLLSQLRSVASSLPDGAVKDQVNATIFSLEERIASVQTSINNLDTLSNDISNNAKSLSNSSALINSSLQNSSNSAIAFNELLYTTTIPTLNSTLNKISAIASELSTSINSQHTLLNEVDTLLTQVESTLSSLKASAQSSDTSLSTFETELSQVQTDINSISLSQRIKALIDEKGLDASSISSFMGSPTTIKSESVYSVNAYGSSMAPLFMNLTFWIGAFMLLVILKTKVPSDSRLILSDKQAYISKWLFLGIFAIMQSTLCCIGVLMIGVQSVNHFALFATSALASLTYLSLMYMLSMTLQHLGKGICVLLAFLQIPAATGLYPVELTTYFFQSVYQLLPFTYGINGIREAICGFYGNDLFVYCAILLAILLVSMFVGIFFRPKLEAFNSLFSRQIKQRGLFVIEDDFEDKKEFRIDEVLSYLASKKEYKEQFTHRANKFMNRHAHFRRYALFGCVSISVILAFLVSNMSYEYKPAILTIWLACLIALMIFAIFTEKANETIVRQMQLDEKTDAQIEELMKNR